MKIVERTQTILKCLLKCHSNLHSVKWHSSEWRFEWRSCNPP